jgi:hypothetical protein
MTANLEKLYCTERLDENRKDGELRLFNIQTSINATKTYEMRQKVRRYWRNRFQAHGISSFQSQIKMIQKNSML